MGWGQTPAGRHTVQEEPHLGGGEQGQIGVEDEPRAVLMLDCPGGCRVEAAPGRLGDDLAALVVRPGCDTGIGCDDDYCRGDCAGLADGVGRNRLAEACPRWAIHDSTEPLLGDAEGLHRDDDRGHAPSKIRPASTSSSVLPPVGTESSHAAS